jgi:RNA polymerase sigma factor (TIGR02999 family)
MADPSEITALLAAHREGDPAALDRLFPLVYGDLRKRAHRQLTRGRPGDTLSTTAVVHEAYLKLTDSSHQTYQDRVHFFAVASQAMRQILVDYARRNAAAKRGGPAAQLVELDADALASPDRGDDLLALDEALIQLESVDRRLARTVELRFFGGLSVEETAEALGVSPRTVKRDWRTARAFLFHAVQERGQAGI